VPLYEYECEACGRRFEAIRKFSDAPLEVCRHCGKGPIHKLLSSPAIQFKGTGWYITDYAQKGKSDSSSTTPAGKTGDTPKADAKADSGGDSAGSTAKTETKTETKSDSSSSATKSKE
jgi:putative FmdB family regulatory protein